MFKKFIIRLLLRLLDGSLRIDYQKIDRVAYENWAYKSVDDPGWRSYLGYEDLKIMKEMGVPKPDYQYWILIGRRLQLLYLGNEMKQVFENRKSAEEKRKSEAEKNKK